MDFFKSKAGILLVLIAVLAAAAVIWYCLAGYVARTEPDGTLVYQVQEEVIL